MNNPSNHGGVTRRQFIALAGGVAGLTALATINFPEGWFANESPAEDNEFEYQDNEADVLVLGSGIAGLFAAVKAHDAGARVMMVSKGRLGTSGQTPFARGIFNYDSATAQVSVDELVDTVSRSALGTSNPVFTRQMVENSKARVDELREWGFFESPLFHNAFKRPMDERKIPIRERIMITHLIKENGCMAGAAGFSLDEKKILFFRAKSVILCTGAGGFKPNGFPICDLTHDGTVMAYAIGAKVTGKEWNDGHGGRSENPAACYDGWQHVLERTPSTTSPEVHHDLGVDINYIAYRKGTPVAMGPPGSSDGNQVSGGPYTPAEFQRSGRPSGPPPGGKGGKGGPPNGGKGGPPGFGGDVMGGASAGLSIHKSEGLVPINDRCESNIPGLYAAGDALGSYMAGAIYTQIGSSLAGSAVQGTIAAEAAAQYCQGRGLSKIPKAKLDQISEEIRAPMRRESGYSPAWVTQTLQGVMIPNFVLYIKKENMLRAALAYVEELRDHHVPLLKASDMHELRLVHETTNMIVNAEMKLRASLLRKESRCSHYRLDYPDIDNDNWQAWINIHRETDGTMKLEKQAFNNWPS